MADECRRRLAQFHAGCAAKRAKQHGQTGLDRGKRDTGIGIGDIRTDPAGHVMPEIADRLFRLHEVEKVHCAYP